ncbi:MAG: 3-hydroxyacyl-CoA dehydrogenase [Rhizobacter sp.]|nr:3-hydroxyacyl-CoA dehydrogenase [Rhizobacter sp.]
MSEDNKPYQLKPDAVVGIVGAGTMGAGIAQVAAMAGHSVKVVDVRPGAAQAAVNQIDDGLGKLVAKGKVKAEDHIAAMSRLQAVDAVADLADAALVIEVIVERLDAKQQLLRELETCVSPSAILASNTSSISVTALANGLAHPRRVVGMHFFNPVPLMKLVEVVHGAETSPEVAQAVFDAARRWGKTPVHARSTPGFIVNRIARPFYAETLALLQEEAATPAVIDRLVRSIGFRMGPCELMDLIGHDVNFAVTQSVFDANYGDRRYAPSLVQKALLDGGRLGRKSGKGFYVGVPAPVALVPVEPPAEMPTLRVVGHGPMAESLAGRLATRGVTFTRLAESDWSGLLVSMQGAVLPVRITDGRTAMECAAIERSPDVAVIDWPIAAATSESIGVAFAATCSEPARAAVRGALAVCGWHASEVRDVPGLVVARTVAMLINEAGDAVHQRVCDEAGADTAMKLGTNYPAGPFEWLAAVGPTPVTRLIDHLFAAYRSEKYRVSPLLRERQFAEAVLLSQQ